MAESIHLVALQNSGNSAELLVDGDHTLENAFERAKKLNGRTPATKGITFLESSDTPATRPLRCDICNDRRSRASTTIDMLIGD